MAFHNKGKNKTLELVEELEKFPNLSQDEYSKRLYDDPKSKAFIMLKSRLMEKMLESLMLSVNMQNNPAYQEDPTALEHVNLHKNMIYASLLRRRGLDTIAEEILQKSAETAAYLRLPEVQIQAAVSLRNISSKESEMWTYKQEIDKYIKQMETDVFGAGLFDEFRVVRTDKTSHSKENVDFLDHALNALEVKLENAYSPRGHYYYLTLRYARNDFIEDPEDARRTLEELIGLLSENPGISSRNRLGIPHLQMAGLELTNFQFEKALESADQALKLFHPKKKNTLTVSTYKLFGLVFLGHLDEAEKLIADLQFFRKQKRLESTINIIRYLHACVHYLRGNTKAASQEIYGVEELLSDKEGWNVGVRLFEIMLSIDMGNYDLATSRIENLRKHTKRYETKDRFITIYRCFQALERVSYSFKNLPKDFLSHFESLAQTSWQPVSNQVIRFEWWVASRISGRPYLDIQLEQIRLIQTAGKG